MLSKIGFDLTSDLLPLALMYSATTLSAILLSDKAQFGK